MPRQINVFSPADTAVYPLRVAGFAQPPGARVAKGEVIVRLEGPSGGLQLAAPFDGTVVRNRVLTGTTLESRAALVTLEVAEADLPARPQSRQTPRAAETPSAAPTGRDQAGAPAYRVHPAFADLAPRTAAAAAGAAATGAGPAVSPEEMKRRRKRTIRRAVTAVAVLAFAWWALPQTRSVVDQGFLTPSLLVNVIQADMRFLPYRVVGGLDALVELPATLLSGIGGSGDFAMAESGTAELRCTGERTYYFAGSLFTGGKAVEDRKDNGLATIAFDFARKKACLRFGRVLTYQDGSLHDELSPQDCVAYSHADDTVSMSTFIMLGDTFEDRTVLDLKDMSLRYRSGRYGESRDRSDIVEATSYALTCKQAG